MGKSLYEFEKMFDDGSDIVTGKLKRSGFWETAKKYKSDVGWFGWIVWIDLFKITFIILTKFKS